MTDLLTADGRVCGARLLDENGEIQTVQALSVLLASGGAGQVYSDTTNPAVATGDGIAAALAAGAELADMEFYQFHPTALSLPGVPRFLLSEALRGEGAWLVNAAGERFMHRYHPLLELAPRDVVARAITREGMGMRPGETLPVYLDMRHVTGIDLDARFPGISAFLHQHGLDLARDLIPVRPAAHYLMGGVRTDVDGRTSLPGLYAAGEVACTGVHGANRLASNSLLEGLVFGARAAESMRRESDLQMKVAEVPAAKPPRDAASLPPVEKPSKSCSSRCGSMPDCCAMPGCSRASITQPRLAMQTRLRPLRGSAVTTRHVPWRGWRARLCSARWRGRRAAAPITAMIFRSVTMHDSALTPI